MCQQHGHMLISPTSPTSAYLSSLSGKYLPLVYIKVLRNSAERIVIPDLPAHTLKAAFIGESGMRDFGSLLEWDLVLNKEWHDLSVCEHLDNRHWFSAKDLPTLIYLCNMKVKSRLYATIEREISSRKTTTKRISVVICTYQRNEKVLAAIKSVLEQNFPSAAYEVIVVNNQMGNPWLEEQIEKLRQDKSLAPGMLRYIQCPIPGLSFARNTGIMESDGELVLFMDDDCLADHDLLYAYVAAFEDHPDAAVMGGQIVVQRPETMVIPWKEGWEKYWSHFVPDYSDCREVNQWGSYPWGANWCARRDVLLRIGGFRTQFGRKGHDFNGGEELVAASLIQQLGHKIYILPQAKVIHDVDSRRFTLIHVRNTIAAGLFSYDLARRSFYLPAGQTRPSYPIQMIQMIRQFGQMLLSTESDDKKAAVLEASYRVRAIALLFLRQVKGWLLL